MARQVALLVGGGFIAGAHLEALRRLGIEVAGVVAATPEHTAQAAQRFNLRPYPDLWSAMHDPAVTVVHDCAPNDVHLEVNLAALKAGKHVFSEKPLGTTPLETRRQLEFARASKLRHAVHFTYRGYPMVRELRERVRRGDLGEIRFIRGRYFQDWLLKSDDYNWRLEAKASETRTVGDIGSHLLDLTRYVTGLEPTRVFARFAQMHQTRHRPSGQVQSFANSGERGTPFTVQTEDQATLLVEYGELVSANFEVAQVYAGHQNDLCLELFGTEGSARWSQENPEEIVLGHRDRPNEVLRKSALLSGEAAKMAHYPGGHPEGYPDAILNAIRAFYASLEQRGFEHQGLEHQGLHQGLEAGYATFEDGHAAALAVSAAQKSHQDGGWVRLEDLELSRERVGGMK
jgi:predicted dehydrogenase